MKKRQRKHILQRVRELTLAGTKKAHICRILKVSDPTVRKYQRLQNLSLRRVDPAEGLHVALGIVDRAFGSEPLPFEPDDVATAAALLELLTKRYPQVYRQATEQNLGELHGLLTQALGVKRICADTGTVH